MLGEWCPNSDRQITMQVSMARLGCQRRVTVFQGLSSRTCDDPLLTYISKDHEDHQQEEGTLAEPSYRGEYMHKNKEK